MQGVEDRGVVGAECGWDRGDRAVDLDAVQQLSGQRDHPRPDGGTGVRVVRAGSVTARQGALTPGLSRELLGTPFHGSRYAHLWRSESAL